MPTLTEKWILKPVQYSDYRRRYLARRAVREALKRAELERPANCELCSGVGDIQAHHIDYNRPLLVFWLCTRCHGLVHRKGHPLNPEKNRTEPVPLEEPELERGPVTAACSLPFENYVLLKHIAEEQGTSISSLLRQAVIKQYPLEDDQKTFDLKITHEKRPKRIQNLAENESDLQSTKDEKLQSVRRARHPSLPGMDF